ncbi:MAG: ribonuclease III [Calditrichaeota bacterium]|nr:ribonuclease III [Calditrichota bacterium]
MLSWVVRLLNLGRKTGHFSRLEPLLGHHFRHPAILQRALTHRSYVGEADEAFSECNETLELLGDAVLDLIVVEELLCRLPKANEGQLSKLKSMLVSGSALERVAARLKLGDFLLLGESEERNGGRNRASILEDVYEAVVGALYLDGGMPVAKRFVHKTVIPRLDILLRHNIDVNYKSQLLEFAQGRGFQPPLYSILRETGPDHHKEFEVEVSLSGRLVGRGAGRSKKMAEQAAAREAMAIMPRFINNIRNSANRGDYDDVDERDE